ncbi:hypothetical protein GXN76_07760 [Kroppenstedtia pulmonis]|uniref:Uncharacterized protein n=1 Tax=Kroppenstedtia pulmonis TaxID=1380685 RepID=A0A7D3Y1S0_9BACL|nr:hypothetical protein [Kroppenstedtia pulmonis]QKG84383.1 hypothetical protein GXN76_07760 [Kroppenstedtia pulmonis]
MKKRWPIAALALVTSLFLLFGGFWGYQYFQIEKPIRQLIDQDPHLSFGEISVQPDLVIVELQPSKDFSLIDDYVPLREKLKKFSQSRKLKVALRDNPDLLLKKSWNEMVFGVEEGMALHHYQSIPKSVERVSKSRGIDYDLGIDGSFILIELRHKKQRLYKVLPLNQSESGVKVND